MLETPKNGRDNMNSHFAVLINPPSPRRSSFVPLGLAYLGSVLTDHKWKVLIIDGSSPYGGHTFKSIADIVFDKKPTFVGIMTTTLFSTYAIDLLIQIKKKSGDTSIICGGPHASLMPDELLEEGADIVVRREGEKTLEDLIPFFDEGADLGEIAGISFKNGKTGAHCHNPDRPLWEDLNALPLPNKDLFNHYDYIKSPYEIYKFSNIITSRGCPFSCSFCSEAVFGKKFRARSVESIIEEMEGLHSKYGLTDFAFIDDCFSVDKNRVIDLCEALYKTKTLQPLTWSCVSRLDIIDDDLLRIMKEAGCIKINYGIESVSDDTLKKINKGFTSSKAKEVVIRTKSMGINCSVNLMWGFPWESHEDIRQNRLFTQELAEYVDDIDPAGIIIPFPGTPLYETYRKEYRFSNWWRDRKAFTGHYRDKIYYPIFRYYGFEDQGLLEDRGFFNYSMKVKNEIIKASLFISKNNLKLHSKLQQTVTWVAILVSRRLYLLYPELESVLSNIFNALIILKKKMSISVP